MGWLNDLAARIRTREAAAKAKRERREREERRERAEPLSSPAARSYQLMGQPIACACSSALFVAGGVSMHSRAASFFDVEWLSGSAATLTCVTCGRIQLFARPPEKTP
jgi:hypothetical protein